MRRKYRVYRIVVADDEETVRNLISKKIDQNCQGFQVVGKAENGQEAIDLVEKLKPDILITDICMPILSGLELIKAVADTGLNIKTVIISGYDDFSYAKTAMTLGVTEYLLKPFMPEELFDVLNKIKDELCRQAALVSNLQKMQNKIEENQEYAKERYLKDLLNGVIEPADIIQAGKEAEIDISADQYCVGVLRFYDLSGGRNIELSTKTIHQFFSTIKEEYFEDKIKIYISGYSDDQLVMIFCGMYRNQEFFQKDIYAGLEKVNHSMEKYYNLKLVCTLGNTYEEVSFITKSYEEAVKVWKGILYQKEAVVRYCDYQQKVAGQNIIKQEKPIEQEKTLITHIQMDRVENAIDTLHEILEYYSRFSADMAEFVSVSLIELVFKISDVVAKAGGGLKVWEDQNILLYLKKHFVSGSLMEAQIVFEEYIIKCCEQFSIVHEKQGDKIVYHVIFMIEQNLDNEEFNLETLSTEMFFSPNYIRQIFKQKTGESFYEFLFRRRMETAGELLLNSDMRIQDIAERTGYSNQRYFARCFRKFYECTPTEYRQKNTDN